MKKKAILIAFLLSSLVASVQAKENNQWYMGSNMGWSRFNLLPKNVDSDTIVENLSKSKLSAPIFGLYFGYAWNPNISFELSNNTIGFSPYLAFQHNKKPMQFNNLQISTRFSYPITTDFSVYTRFSESAFWDELVKKDNIKNVFDKNSIFIPGVSFGAEYIFYNKFITRIDYTWKNSIKNISNLEIKPTLGDAVFSLGWKFSSSSEKKTALKIFKAPKQSYVTLNESINFPFNSSEIQPSSYDKLRSLERKIKKINLKNISVVLLGYADKMGKENYNQKLSEERAWNVKNYFNAKGLFTKNISVQGMGEKYSITNQVCKNIKDRSLLISCLAPDRRVDIEVLGTK